MKRNNGLKNILTIQTYMNKKFAIIAVATALLFVTALSLIGANTDELKCTTNTSNVTCVLSSYTPTETRIYLEPEQNITALPSNTVEPGTVMDPEPSCVNDEDILVCTNFKAGDSAVIETSTRDIPVAIVSQ